MLKDEYYLQQHYSLFMYRVKFNDDNKIMMECGISYSFNGFHFVSMGSNSTTNARSKQVPAYKLMVV